MYKKRANKKILLIIASTIFFAIIITLYNVYSMIDINTYEDTSKKNAIRLSRQHRTGKRNQ